MCVKTSYSHLWHLMKHHGDVDQAFEAWKHDKWQHHLPLATKDASEKGVKVKLFADYKKWYQITRNEAVWWRDRQKRP